MAESAEPGVGLLCCALAYNNISGITTFVIEVVILFFVCVVLVRSLPYYGE